jgi:hypothetical protein
MVRVDVGWGCGGVHCDDRSHGINASRWRLTRLRTMRVVPRRFCSRVDVLRFRTGDSESAWDHAYRTHRMARRPVALTTYHASCHRGIVTHQRSTDKVWLVKLPKWLLEHWSKVDQDNVELASVVVPYADFRLSKQNRDN